MALYLLDANTFIEAKNRHYRMHVVPGYWQWLDLHLAQEMLGTINMVFTELTRGSDELAAWARDRKELGVAVEDEATQACFSEIANYIMTSHYREPERTAFLEGADPWLIAKAAVINAEVVTHESRVPDESKKVKVPNVCEVFGVGYRDTFDLLEELEARLVLAE